MIHELGPTSRDWLEPLASGTRRFLPAERLTRRQRYAAEKYETIDAVLTLMNGLKFIQDDAEHAGVQLPASAFSGTWLALEELTEVMGEDLIYFNRDVFDLWPINSRFGNAGHLNALQTVAPNDVRGRVIRLMPRMLRHARAWISGGRAYTSANYYGVRDDNSLVNITNPAEYGMVPVVTEYTAEMVTAIAGFQLTAEYSWSVEIKARGSNFAVRIPTSPEGARRLLSLRDVEAGATRRRALRHWVRSHYRYLERPGGDTDRVPVKAHLRGVTPFTWEDFEGFVRPSAYELRQLDGGAS